MFVCVRKCVHVNERVKERLRERENVRVCVDDSKDKWLEKDANLIANGFTYKEVNCRQPCL